MIEAVKALYRNQNPLDEPKFAMRGHEDGVMTFGRDLREAEMVLYEIVGGEGVGHRLESGLNTIYSVFLIVNKFLKYLVKQFGYNG